MNINKIFKQIPLSQIVTNPINPRKNFEGPKFDELVASVRNVGILEPILIRPTSENIYEIVAGERRFRACCLIASENGGLENYSIPSIIQEMTDDEAFDIMTIENLQRVDLTELEEAQGFKMYMDKKGKDILPELAERTSKSPQYITRRVMVLNLPSKALKAWEKGEIKFGHCEQLCRLKDKNLILEFLDRLLDKGDYYRIETVNQLKTQIDSRAISLKWAKFNKNDAGCPSCQSNTEFQKQLFDEQPGGSSLCTNPTCFNKNQTTWLTKNWSKCGRNFGTNGFRFDSDIKYSDHNDFEFTGQPGEKCRECSYFVTILHMDGKISQYGKQSCVGDKSCFNQVIKSNCVNKDDANDNGKSSRAGLHGQYFREEHFKKRIPEAISTLLLDDIRCLQLSLFSILKSNPNCRISFARQYCPEYANEENLFSYEIDTDIVLQNVLAMSVEQITQAHRNISASIIMQLDTFTPEDRYIFSKGEDSGKIYLPYSPLNPLNTQL